MPNSLGTLTKTIFLKGAENHKLHHEFEVDSASDLKKGQMVKLSSTGTIVALAAADTQDLFIGVCIHDAKKGELCTVVTRGYAILRAQSSGALTPGPVEAGTFDGTNLVNEFDASSGETKSIGWALDVATGADEEIRVLIKD